MKPNPCITCKGEAAMSFFLQLGTETYLVVCTLCGKLGPIRKTKRAARAIWNTLNPKAK